MSNINASLGLRYVRNGDTEQLNFSYEADVNTAPRLNKTVPVTTSPAQIDLTGITTPRQVVLQNLSEANYIEIQLGDGGDPFGLRIPPLQFAVFTLNGEDLYAKANTATCQLRVIVWGA